jgi:hypothetical protein
MKRLTRWDLYSVVAIAILLLLSGSGGTLWAQYGALAIIAVRIISLGGSIASVREIDPSERTRISVSQCLFAVGIAAAMVFFGTMRHEWWPNRYVPGLTTWDRYVMLVMAVVAPISLLAGVIAFMAERNGASDAAQR